MKKVLIYFDDVIIKNKMQNFMDCFHIGVYLDIFNCRTYTKTLFGYNTKHLKENKTKLKFL